MARRSARGFALALLVALAWPAGADELDLEPGRTISNLSLSAFGLTVLSRWRSDNPARAETGRRGADALLLSGVLAEALQRTIDDKRPEPYADENGFPSGHTAMAFALASVFAEREPNTRWLGYSLATAVGWSRVQVKRHDWTQVAAGAVLGSWIGHLCGEGKLAVFGHNDSELPGVHAADGPRGLGTPNRTVLWGVDF